MYTPARVNPVYLTCYSMPSNSKMDPRAIRYKVELLS